MLDSCKVNHHDRLRSRTKLKNILERDFTL